MSRPDISASPRDAVVGSIFGALAPDGGAALISGERTISWAEWVQSVEHLAAKYSALARARVGLPMVASDQTYAILVALALAGCDLFLLDERASREEVEQIARDSRLDATIEPERPGEPSSTRPTRPEGPEPGAEVSTVTIFTSGSSGRPKPVAHSWESLCRTIRKARAGSPQRWLLTYRPHLYAGVQVFLHCLLNQETLVLPRPGMAVDSLLTLMRKAGVTAASATPSFWRRLITLGSRDTLAAIPLEQITLGGEIADQPLLDALKHSFPSARLVHIYATSELGRCFSVTDGMAGFPAALLEAPSDHGVELKIEAGELFVRTINAMLGADGGRAQGGQQTEWRGTGDQVEVVGDRCFFVGRRSDHINVGGNKVQPVRVEGVIQQVPGVRDVRVFARRSSLVGEMVACEFIAEPGCDPAGVKQAVIKSCLERLAAHERPRWVEPVPTIALSSAGKKIRKPGATGDEQDGTLAAGHGQE
jgi:acyl-CoA synthetase (AMP-forming)/AMP-acid ligase II